MPTVLREQGFRFHRVGDPELNQCCDRTALLRQSDGGPTVGHSRAEAVGCACEPYTR